MSPIAEDYFARNEDAPAAWARPISHATVRNHLDGHLLRCDVCEAEEFLQPPMPLDEFVRLIRRFNAAHQHPEEVDRAE